VIHAVGPIWHCGNAGEAGLLESAYRSAFQLALDHGDIRTVAFPAISTGVYGYPADQAARIALSVMRECEPRFQEIVACVFDDRMLEVYQWAGG
jgi:O-acetyl-ADP-ribose deacetylase (regulator of RNase III)